MPREFDTRERWNTILICVGRGKKDASPSGSVYDYDANGCVVLPRVLFVLWLLTVLQVRMVKAVSHLSGFSILLWKTVLNETTSLKSQYH